MIVVLVLVLVIEVVVVSTLNDIRFEMNKYSDEGRAFPWSIED